MQTSCWQAAAAQLPGQQLAACRHWLPRTHDATHCIYHAIIAIARWKSHCGKQLGTREKASSGAIRDVDAPACSLHNHRLPCSHSPSMSAGMRTPAAQPPLSKFWSRGSEARTSFSLEDETSCHKNATSSD